MKLTFVGGRRTSPTYRSLYYYLVPLCLALCLFRVSTVFAQNNISEFEFWSLAAETEAVLRSNETTTETLESLAVRWDAVSTIELEDGTTLPFDNDYYVAALRDPELDRAHFAEQLATLQYARGSLSGHLSDSGAGDNATQILEEILSDEDFQYRDENQGSSLIRRILLALLDALARFAGWFLSIFGFRDVAGGNVLAWLLRFVVIVTAIGGIFYVLRWLSKGLFVQAAQLDFQEDDATILTADDALTKANVVSESGDYRNGVRYLYLSLLLTLEERGLIRYDRSLTNREYLLSVRRQPELAKVLTDVIEIFDRTWYGFQPIDETIYRQYSEQVKALRKQKPTVSP